MDNPDNRYIPVQNLTYDGIAEVDLLKHSNAPRKLKDGSFEVLRPMTPAEQWKMKDDLKSLKHLVDSLVDDCFVHDMVFGFSVRGLDDK